MDGSPANVNPPPTAIGGGFFGATMHFYFLGSSIAPYRSMRKYAERPSRHSAAIRDYLLGTYDRASSFAKSSKE